MVTEEGTIATGTQIETMDETENEDEAGAEKSTETTKGTMILEGPVPSMMTTDSKHPRIRDLSAECILNEEAEEGLAALSPVMQTFWIGEYSVSCC